MKTAIKVKQFTWEMYKPDLPTPKIAVGFESVGTASSQLAGLVLSLIKCELIRLNAFNRWQIYIDQVGLRLKDLIVYLDVLSDDNQLVLDLKNYYGRLSNSHEDKLQLLRESNQLKEHLIESIKRQKVLNTFPVKEVPVIEMQTI